MATLSQFGYALAVDRHRNFRRAAKACFISQPTLSMQLAKLEDELAVVLFDRSRRPVVPTREGAVLLEQFRTVMREYERIEEVVQAASRDWWPGNARGLVIEPDVGMVGDGGAGVNVIARRRRYRHREEAPVPSSRGGEADVAIS